MEDRLQRLKELLSEIDDLHKAAYVLEWDQQTYMPPGGVEARAKQLATLQKIAHARFVSDEVGKLLETLKKLVKNRGRLGRERIGRKDVKGMANDIMKGLSVNKTALNPVFRLSPPRKGYKSLKKHYPRGALGYRREKINELLKRML